MPRITQITQLGHHLQRQHIHRSSIPSYDANSRTSEAIAGVAAGCIIGFLAFMITLYSVCRCLPRASYRGDTSAWDTDDSSNSGASVIVVNTAGTRTRPPRPQGQMQPQASRETPGGPSGTVASGGGEGGIEDVGGRERAVMVGV